MTSTNDGKDVKSNQPSGPKGKSYYIDLYRSIEAGLEAGDVTERTKHLCSAWRRVHSLFQHSAPPTQTHLFGWIQRHTARTVLQAKWREPAHKDDRQSLSEAITSFISEAEAAKTSRHGVSPLWEVQLVARGEWYKTILEKPWDHPVLKLLVNPNDTPPTDDELLKWLKDERGVTFVMRIHTLVAERVPDIATTLASAVMGRVRAAGPPCVDVDDPVDKPPADPTETTFGDRLKEEAGFIDVWDLLTDMEFVLLHKLDSKKCIALAKQTPLDGAYRLIERLPKRLETSPREKKLWKNAKEVAILIAQVMIARCMMIPTCLGTARNALYCCVRLLAQLVPPARLPTDADALANRAPTARHLHTLAQAVDKELSTTDVKMKPYVCELYVRAITAGMNELERLKLKTEKEAEARLMENKLASWFVQLGSVLCQSDRMLCECTLTAFSVHPSQKMYERVSGAPQPAPQPIDPDVTKEETVKSEFGSWANDSRSQTNFVKTSETLNMKHTQNQANVLSTAIFNEGEALGLSPELCQDIAVLLSGPRVKTLSWDMDRSLLMENCRSYMIATHGGTRLLTRELKYLNIDPAQYQHLPEEQDDENDPYYGIERGYEHLVPEEPEDLWEDIDEKTETASSSIEDDFIAPRRKKKSKPKARPSVNEDSDPLSVMADAKREKEQKKKERPHSKERSKERAKKKLEEVDPLSIDTPEPNQTQPKVKKERKKKEPGPKPKPKKCLAALIGLKVAKTKKKPMKVVKNKTTAVAPATDRDYDSQSKNSLTSMNSGTDHEILNLEDLKGRERKNSLDTMKPIKNTTKNKIAAGKPKITYAQSFERHVNSVSRMPYKPPAPAVIRAPSPINFTRHNVPNVKRPQDDIRASLSKLLDIRRQQNAMGININNQPKNSVVQSPRKPAILRPDIPIQTNISPKAVSIPDIPKSYIQKQYADKLAELKREVDHQAVQRRKETVRNAHPAIPSPVIQYAKKSYSDPNSFVRDNEVRQYQAAAHNRTDPASVPYARLMAEITERQDLTKRYYENARTPHGQQATYSTPQQRSHSVMTAGLRDYHNFLKEYECSKYGDSTRALDMSKRPPQEKKKEMRAISKVTPVVPSLSAKPESKTPSAKQSTQQKKPDNSLNTFSRLSYIHKNKQMEMKNKLSEQPLRDSKTYQDVSSELDQIIKEHQEAQRRVIKAKNERFDRLLENTTNALVEASDVENHKVNKNYEMPKPKAKDHSLLTSLLQKSSSIDNCSLINKSLFGDMHKTVSPPKKTSLSEKDQNDLLYLLRQQNKLNSPNHYTTNNPTPSTSKSNNAASKTAAPTINYNSTSFEVQHNLNTATACVNNKPTMCNSHAINIISNALIKPAHSVNAGNLSNTKAKSVKLSTIKNIQPTDPEDNIKKTINKSESNSNSVKYGCESDKPEWQVVMGDLLRHKTPTRGPNALDVALKKSSFELAFEKSLQTPTIFSTKSKTEDNLESDKHKDNLISRTATPPIHNVVISSSKVVKNQGNDAKLTKKTEFKQSDCSNNAQIQKRKPPEMAKKLTHEVQRKQFTYPGAKDIDPFISGIRNSDYDLLEELMDDDLRKEIGELSSDDESYNAAAQSFLKPNKGTEKRVSVEYNKYIIDAAVKKSEVQCAKARQSTIERKLSKPKHCNKTAQIQAEGKDSVAIRVSTKTQDNASLIAPTPQTNLPHVSIAPALTNQVAVEPNIYISAVPQQAPLQNVVLIGSQLVYDGYSTVQTPVHAVSAMASSAYVTVNNTSNMTLYDTPQFGASVANPLIIGSALTVPIVNSVGIPVISNTVSNNVEQPTYLTSSVESQESRGQKLVPRAIMEPCKSQCETSKPADEAGCHIEKQLSHTADTIKTSERKVLSEVQEFAATENVEKAWSQKIEYEIKQKKDAAAEQERLKKKRLAIVNREIYHRCRDEPIPLAYSPLPKQQEHSKLISQLDTHPHPEKHSQESICDEDRILLTKIQNDLQDLSDAINDVRSPATPDSTDSKENKSTRVVSCRRILLRSSNKIVPKTNIETITTVTTMNKKSKVKLKSDKSVPIKNKSPCLNANKDNKDTSVQKRASKRLRNKTSTIRKEVEKTTAKLNQEPKPNTKPKVLVKNNSSMKRDTTEKPNVGCNTTATEIFDIEAELLVSKIERDVSKNFIEKCSNSRNGKINNAVEEAILMADVSLPIENLKDETSNEKIKIDTTDAKKIREPKTDDTKVVTNEVFRSETSADYICGNEYDKPVVNSTINEVDTAIVKDQGTNNYLTKQDLHIPNNEKLELKPTKIVSGSHGEGTNVVTAKADVSLVSLPTSLNQPVLLTYSKDLSTKTNLLNDVDIPKVLDARNVVQITVPDSENLNLKVIPEKRLNIVNSNSKDSVSENMVQCSKPIEKRENENNSDDFKKVEDGEIEVTAPIIGNVESEKDLDLDMTVTCEEVIPKMPLDFGKIKIARKTTDTIKIIEKTKSTTDEVNETIEQSRTQISISSDIVSKPTKVVTNEAVSDDPASPAQELNQELKSNIKNSSEMASKAPTTTASEGDDDDIILIDDEPSNESNTIGPAMLTNCDSPQKHIDPHGMSLRDMNDVSKIPQSFKDSIIIQHLPTDDPLKKSVRVTLPDGRKCKATVYGEVHVTIDSLFACPSLRAALFNKFDSKKLVLNQITTVDSNDPRKILSAHIQDSLQTQQDKVTNQESRKVVETIDLLSDDEENSPAGVINKDIQTIDTEYGKYKISPMNNDVFKKHQEILNRKSLIILDKCDSKVTVSDKEKNISEVVEIDDSSNDSLNLSNVCGNLKVGDKINELKNVLLKELGVELKPKPAINNLEKVQIEKDATIIEIIDPDIESIEKGPIQNDKFEIQILKSENECVNRTQTVEEAPCMEAVLTTDPKLPVIMTCDENSYGQFANINKKEQINIINRKCYIKLRRCDELVQTTKRSGEAESLSDIAMQDDPIIIADFSILDDLDTNTIDESEARSSSPVIQLSDVLATLESQCDLTLNNIKTHRNVSLSCEASWFHTKKMLHSASVNELISNITGHCNEDTDDESSKPCVIDVMKTEATLFQSIETPSLKSLVLKCFQDINVILQYASQSACITQYRKKSLKRKSTCLGMDAAKIIKLDNTLNEPKLTEYSFSSTITLDSSATDISNLSLADEDSKREPEIKICLANIPADSLENLLKNNSQNTDDSTGSLNTISDKNHYVDDRSVNKVALSDVNSKDPLNSDFEKEESIDIDTVLKSDNQDINSTNEKARTLQIFDKFSESKEISSDFTRKSCTPSPVLQLAKISLDYDKTNIYCVPIPKVDKSTNKSSQSNNEGSSLVMVTNMQHQESNEIVIAPHVQSANNMMFGSNDENPTLLMMNEEIAMNFTPLDSPEIEVISEDANDCPPSPKIVENIMFEEPSGVIRISASPPLEVANILTSEEENDSPVSSTVNEETERLGINAMMSPFSPLPKLENIINCDKSDNIKLQDICESALSSAINETTKSLINSVRTSTSVPSPKIDLTSIISEDKIEGKSQSLPIVNKECESRENSLVYIIPLASVENEIDKLTFDFNNDCPVPLTLNREIELHENTSMNSIPVKSSQRDIANITLEMCDSVPSLQTIVTNIFCNYLNNCLPKPTVNKEIQLKQNNAIDSTAAPSSQIEIENLTSDYDDECSPSLNVCKEIQPYETSDANEDLVRYTIIKNVDRIKSKCDNDTYSLAIMDVDIQPRQIIETNSEHIPALITEIPVSDNNSNLSSIEDERMQPRLVNETSNHRVPSPAPDVPLSEIDNDCDQSTAVNIEMQPDLTRETDSDRVPSPADMSSLSKRDCNQSTMVNREMRPQLAKKKYSDGLTSPAIYIQSEHDNDCVPSTIVDEDMQPQLSIETHSDHLPSPSLVMSSLSKRDCNQSTMVNREMKPQLARKKCNDGIPSLSIDIQSEHDKYCDQATVVDKEIKPKLSGKADSNCVPSPGIDVSLREYGNDCDNSTIVSEEIQLQPTNDTRIELEPSKVIGISISNDDKLTDQSTIVEDQMQPQLTKQTNNNRIPSHEMDVLLFERDNDNGQATKAYEKMEPQLVNETDCNLVPSSAIDIVISECDNDRNHSTVGDEEMQPQATIEANIDTVMLPPIINISEYDSHKDPSEIVDEKMQPKFTSETNSNRLPSSIIEESNIIFKCYNNDQPVIKETDKLKPQEDQDKNNAGVISPKMRIVNLYSESDKDNVLLSKINIEKQPQETTPIECAHIPFSNALSSSSEIGCYSMVANNKQMQRQESNNKDDKVDSLDSICSILELEKADEPRLENDITDKSNAHDCSMQYLTNEGNKRNINSDDLSSDDIEIKLAAIVGESLVDDGIVKRQNQHKINLSDKAVNDNQILHVDNNKNETRIIGTNSIDSEQKEINRKEIPEFVKLNQYEESQTEKCSVNIDHKYGISGSTASILENINDRSEENHEELEEVVIILADESFDDIEQEIVEMQCGDVIDDFAFSDIGSFKVEFEKLGKDSKEEISHKGIQDLRTLDEKEPKPNKDFNMSQEKSDSVKSKVQEDSSEETNDSSDGNDRMPASNTDDLSKNVMDLRNKTEYIEDEVKPMRGPYVVLENQDAGTCCVIPINDKSVKSLTTKENIKVGSAITRMHSVNRTIRDKPDLLLSNQQSSLKLNTDNPHKGYDDIEVRLAEIVGEPLVENGSGEKITVTDVKCKALYSVKVEIVSESDTFHLSPSPLSGDVENHLTRTNIEYHVEKTAPNINSLSNSTNLQCLDHIHNQGDEPETENLRVMLPKHTYSTSMKLNGQRLKNLKRKMEMSDVKTHAKKYRKGKNIDYRLTVGAHLETAYVKEYKRLFDYCSSVKFSYAIPFHKDHIDVHQTLKSWPINKSHTLVTETMETNETLYSDLEKPKYMVDPLHQTLPEEIISEYDEYNYRPSNINETNFTTGFGEGSGRVIQEWKDGEYITFSAATLSDVKQLQPLVPSDEQEAFVKRPNCDYHDREDQWLKTKRFVDHLNIREKVRRFFEKTSAELNSDLQLNNKKDALDDTHTWPFGFTSINFIRPPPVEVTVNVVQVGQLPASAAAQNPVTCDPRVTHVSNVSPSQCSPENSSGDDIQTTIKTEYTELTTADITLPLMQEYAQHHHSTAGESQEPTNLYGSNDSMATEIKSVVKIELVDETSQENMEENEDYENNGLQLPSNGNINNGMQYTFHNITNMAERENKAQMSINSEKPKICDSSDSKQQNVSMHKSDQIVNAMNAAGITAAQGMAKANNNEVLVHKLPRNAQSEVVTTSQANTNYSKPTSINAISLQQALAQILPPPLNQTNTTENSQLASANAQVLHIVQGNNNPSVINKPNGTQLLHIVQNKTASSTNGTPTSQPNTFTGLSLADGSIQQNGNQLLHIVNTGTQKNNNAGQLLKRVNLLTNLANVQGSNDQKMVQFVCKSSDGKSIQLPHQRSMVLRLQPLDPPNPNAPTNAVKQNENQEHNPSSSTTNQATSKEATSQEMKSRSLYEENYAKFVQNGESKQIQEKATCLPKFNQVFGKQVYQDKTSEVERDNLPENSETPSQENNIPLEQMTDSNNTTGLTRKPAPQPPPAQPNLVQQIKQTIGPMNIQTMHGGVIYTRQIPVNLGGGQTINLITVPTTEMVDEPAQKQQGDGKFVNQDSDPPIIKIVQTNQPAANSNATEDTNNAQLGSTSESNPQPNPQPQPVLTQMRIKLPMLSKAPQMVGGTRLVRPSFFQIQRNVIGGANQQVYQQLVLTAAPPLGQSIRLPVQVQKPKTPSETQSSPESQMSSSTLEQLREFDMVLEQVKERSTVQPGSSTSSNFTKLNNTADAADAPTPSTSSQKSPTPVLYSVGNTQPLNIVNYVNRKSTITSTTSSSFVRSPDSTAVIESPSSSSQSHLPHTVTSDSCASSSCASEAAATTSQPKPKKKKPKPSTSNSNPFNIKNTPKPSSQKPLEDEQTTQRILYILAEYKEQVENSPDKDKPAPRRRNNPGAPNAGSSKRKKSGSRRRDMSPVLGEDSCRTMGSEDSSCGTSMGECNECLESHSPEDSPRKVVRRLTFEQETNVTQTRTLPAQRNVIVADGQAFAVRGATGKPATTVLMPANYLLPVSMVKGGQQIAIVTNRGPKLLVGAGDGGAGGALLFQRLIGPGGLKPVLTRPGVRHIRLPTAALHNLQAFNIAAPATTVQPPDSTASPAPAPTPPDLVDTRAMSSPWPDRNGDEAKPERGNSSPEGSEPWNLPSSSIADDYGYEEIVRTDNMDRTVLDAIPDRYSPDIEAQRIFDKMFDVDSKKSMYDSRCSYDIDASDDDKAYHQVVQRKDGRHTRLTHVSAAALRHKYAILEHELRLQKSLSEECEDLGVDTPSASELFPEAELLFAPSPAHEQTIDQCQSPPPPLSQGIPQPDLDDQIATDHLLTHKDRHDDLDINLDDVGEIVTVGDDGMTTIPLDHEEFARSHEEFARSHPNTTFHSEPEDGEIPPFTIAQGLKGRPITFHGRGVPGTVVMAPQTTVISQATVEAAGTHTVKFTDIDNMINAMPSPHQHAPSVLKDNQPISKFDRLFEHRPQSNPIVHSTGNGTQVIRRLHSERRDARYSDDTDALMSDARDRDDTSPDRHPELFWESAARPERRRFDFSSDSDKCCKSPYDETNSDSSGIGVHTRLDSVIKAARTERRRSDGSSEDGHRPLRTYPAKRAHAHSDADRSVTGKTRAGDRCDKDESRRRASNRGVVKRGCHCCNGSTAPPKPKKSRPKKTHDYPH